MTPVGDYQKKWGCEICLATPIEAPYLGEGPMVVEMVATAEAKCEIVARNIIIHPSALFAPSRLHCLVLRHPLPAAVNGLVFVAYPPGS